MFVLRYCPPMLCILAIAVSPALAADSLELLEDFTGHLGAAAHTLVDGVIAAGHTPYHVGKGITGDLLAKVGGRLVG